MGALDTIKNYTSLRQAEHWRQKGFTTCHIQLVMSISSAKSLKPLLVTAMIQTSKSYKQTPEEPIKETVKISSVVLGWL